MLHYMFAVKNDSALFESFKARFNKEGLFTRDDLNVKMVVDPLPSFTIDGNRDNVNTKVLLDQHNRIGYSQVCLIITPSVYNTTMLNKALNHQEIFNKYFEGEEALITETTSCLNPFVLIIGEEVVASPVKYISTFGDELSVLKKLGSPVAKHKELLELIVEGKYKIVRSCALNPTHLKMGRAILDILKVAIIEYKANGVTPSITDMIISGHLYFILENLPNVAREFFIKLICHTYIALNYISINPYRQDYANFVINTISTFEYPGFKQTSEYEV